MSNFSKLKAMLEVMRNEVLPLVESVAIMGNALSGGVVMRQDTLTSVIVGADYQIENPVIHGEMDVINRFFKLPVHPPAEELLIMVTHEPCPMCATAIALAGFKELWVLFPSDDPAVPGTVVPHLYRDLFGVKGLRQDNNFFDRRYIRTAIEENSRSEELMEIFDEISMRYAAMHTASA
jgi:tRNA(Arg) A34 adenosine deaminase TadA